MENKPLHEMTEEELRAEVKTWDLDVWNKYKQENCDVIIVDFGFDDDA